MSVSEINRKKTNKRRDVAETVRKGAPSNVRRDLYFYLIKANWFHVIVSLVILFLMTNIFFAVLYLLQPGSVTNMRPGSFWDAFFFSVQTLATIGYGVLSPATTYANIIVTFEAALGVLGVAVTTGLVFAKVSRARASVLFSQSCVVTQMNGKKTLVFRAGNARGNEVVDATMSLTVLMDEYTPEGHHIRRLHELPLVRSRSSMFILSWVVMHTIDEASPLANIDWKNPGQKIISMVATLIGHDGTYGQTIYARHIYYPEDVRFNHRFVDVISQLDDGRLMIDYTRFHDTVAEMQSQ